MSADMFGIRIINAKASHAFHITRIIIIHLEMLIVIKLICA